jgi:hypothetical protein
MCIVFVYLGIYALQHTITTYNGVRRERHKSGDRKLPQRIRLVMAFLYLRCIFTIPALISYLESAGILVSNENVF